MPYIKPETREGIDYLIAPMGALLNKVDLNPELLNYIITRILLSTLPASYEDYNILIGVLESVKLEFYRRVVTPYEDKRKEERGDVY